MWACFLFREIIERVDVANSREHQRFLFIKNLYKNLLYEMATVSFTINFLHGISLKMWQKSKICGISMYDEMRS